MSENGKCHLCCTRYVCAHCAIMCICVRVCDLFINTYVCKYVYVYMLENVNIREWKDTLVLHRVCKLCLCLCVYVVYGYMCICVFLCMCTRERMLMSENGMQLYVLRPVGEYICHMYIYVYADIRLCIYMLVYHIRVHICIDICMYLYIHVRTYIYIYHCIYMHMYI